MGTGLTKKDHIWRLAIISLAATCLIAGLLYYITRLYVISQAEKNIQNLLLFQRGIHHYVQQVMHPALYEFKDDGEIPADFYAPEMFSSSFMVRNQHAYYNEERKNAGLPEIYFKMAAINPRNPVNKADALEEQLIRMFNEKRGVKEYRDIISLNGKKYLYYAIPFLETKEACLKCHGERVSAPHQLQERYPGMGGFGDQPGHFRAIESIRAPLQEEFYVVNIISGVLFSALITFLTLFLFNGRLQKLVKLRTEDLEAEIATRKKAEMQVRKLNEQLEQKVEARTMQLEAANKELDAFAYSVSHDLRAPLRGIDGFSQALLEDYGDRFDEQGKDYINRVRTGCFRMGNLIDDMLKLSRLSRGEIDRKPVNLSEIAEAIAEDQQRSAPDRQVKLTIAPGIIVNGDATLLRAVMENLLGNAWKFTGKTVDAAIDFGTIQEDGSTVYFVKDNGAGFNMEYADKLFAPFQRLHSVNEFVGTGIGLATVKRIMHRHGGDIRGEGSVGQGATFYFWLK